MYRNITFPALRWIAIVLTVATIGGCGSTLERLADVGDGPELSKIKNPVARSDYRPVSMPMPAPQIVADNPNSLWRSGARAFFKDTRAKEVGDILTVELTLPCCQFTCKTKDGNFTLKKEGHFTRKKKRAILPVNKRWSFYP